MTATSDSKISSEFPTYVYSTDSPITTPVSFSIVSNTREEFFHTAANISTESKLDDARSAPLTTFSPDITPYSFETTDSLIKESRHRKISNNLKKKPIKLIKIYIKIGYQILRTTNDEKTDPFFLEQVTELMSETSNFMKITSNNSYESSIMPTRPTYDFTIITEESPNTEISDSTVVDSSTFRPTVAATEFTEDFGENTKVLPTKNTTVTTTINSLNTIKDSESTSIMVSSASKPISSSKKTFVKETYLITATTFENKISSSIEMSEESSIKYSTMGLHPTKNPISTRKSEAFMKITSSER